jgi:hypothetical protein
MGLEAEFVQPKILLLKIHIYFYGMRIPYLFLIAWSSSFAILQVLGIVSSTLCQYAISSFILSIDAIYCAHGASKA